MGDNFSALSEQETPEILERKCVGCGGPADVPQPVKNKYPKPSGHWTNQPYIPNPNGSMLCWGCYDSLKKRG